MYKMRKKLCIGTTARTIFLTKRGCVQLLQPIKKAIYGYIDGVNRRYKKGGAASHRCYWRFGRWPWKRGQAFTATYQDWARRRLAVVYISP